MMDLQGTEPQAGSDVRLLPVDESGLHHGVLTSWSTGPGGLVVTSTVRLTKGSVEALVGARVWVETQGPSGQARVHEALARPTLNHSELDLTGVMLAADTRRTAVRAPLTLAARLAAPGVESVAAQTVDVSAGGMRLAVEDDIDLAVGDDVEVTVFMGDDDAPVLATGQVASSGEDSVGLRLQIASDDDRERLERVVLQQIAASSPDTGS